MNARFRYAPQTFGARTARRVLPAPVLDKARLFDISTNPDPRAIYEPGSGDLQIRCTPDDHLRGWEEIRLDAGTFSKPCGYVASIHWEWGVDNHEEEITHLALSTSAYTQFTPMGQTDAHTLLAIAAFFRDHPDGLVKVGVWPETTWVPDSFGNGFTSA